MSFITYIIKREGLENHEVEILYPKSSGTTQIFGNFCKCLDSILTMHKDVASKDEKIDIMLHLGQIPFQAYEKSLTRKIVEMYNSQ